MKTLLHLLAISLFTLSQAFAQNTVYGTGAGNGGTANTFLGFASGYLNTTGSNNTFLSNYSGYKNTSGFENTFLGYTSGFSNTIGNNNTFLGRESGYTNQSGNSNVFIGYRAGYSETGSNKLYIDDNNDNNPLLYGNFSSNVLSIGTKYTGTAYKLVVPGKVRAAAYWVRVNNKDIKVGRVANSVNTLQDALAKV